VSALKEKIVRLIRAQGPITIAEYMQIALADPFHGYYIARDPFGRDFVTAPEVSQIFGELVGLCFVQAWEDRGRPGAFSLVELGPGRGTLMADMLRAAEKVRPEFVEAAKLVLVETSPMLRSIQKQNLARYEPHWALRLDEISDDAPAYFVANEFFDALPIRQFVRRGTGWHERMVSEANDALHFVLTPEPQPLSGITRLPLSDAREEDVWEINPRAVALTEEIATRIAKKDGLALFIDYGHAEAGYGDTLQAVKANAYADPLCAPGEADLTAHIDFAALKEAASGIGAEVAGPTTQREFLQRLGIALRADKLKSSAPEKSAEIDAAVERLTGENAMGNLFKVMALSANGRAALAGF
jgi:NADH dehydrogenase [ubiquinone] 1 alpha subcomplex assembly factor 7